MPSLPGLNQAQVEGGLPDAVKRGRVVERAKARMASVSASGPAADMCEPAVWSVLGHWALQLFLLAF